VESRGPGVVEPFIDGRYRGSISRAVNESNEAFMGKASMDTYLSRSRSYGSREGLGGATFEVLWSVG
jgi:hypothetical protein